MLSCTYYGSVRTQFLSNFTCPTLLDPSRSEPVSPGSSRLPGTPRPTPSPGTRHSAALHTHPPGSVGAAGLALLAPSHPSLFRSVPCEAGFMDQISHSPCRLTFRWIRPVEDGRMGGREGGEQQREVLLSLHHLHYCSILPSLRPSVLPSTATAGSFRAKPKLC